MRRALSWAFAVSMFTMGSEARAEEATTSSERPRRSVDVQIDPTPFFRSGFAPELGYTAGRHRIMATVLAYDVPHFLDEDSKFDERRKLVVAVAYQFFFIDHLDGLFAGLGLSHVSSTFTLRSTGSTHDAETWKTTLRVGWVLKPSRVVPEFFVAPWLGWAFNIAPERFRIDDQLIKRERAGLLGAVQLGWRFSL